MADVSIMITGKDNLSSVLKKLSETTNNYKKDLNGLDDRLQVLTKTQGNLAAELTESKKALSDAQKAFRATGDEADKMRVAMEQTKVEGIKQKMRAVSAEMKSTERDMQSLTSSASKMDTQLSQVGTTTAKGLSDTMSALAKAGLFGMVGNAAGGLAGTLVTSSLGTSAGSMVNSVVSGAATGAAIGSVVPGLGTAVGGLIGAITGALSGLTEEQQRRDAAFQTVVQDTYNEVTTAQQEQLSSGSEIAAQREVDRLAFNTLFGSSSVAGGFLSRVQDMAAETPFEYSDLTDMSRNLATYGYDANQILDLMPKIGDAGAALGLGGYDMSAIATYIGRMNSSDKTTMQYLDPLIERGIPAIDYLAEALGDENGPLATQDVYDMISKGEISGKEAAQIIADAMGEQFEGSMEDQAKTYSGLMSTLEDNQADLDNAMGEGYNETRKDALQEQIDWMSGESGEKLKEANRLIGVYQASLVNEQEQAYRDAMDAALQKIQDEGITDEAEMGKILAEAQAQAKADYLASDAYQNELNTQMGLVDSIQEKMAPVYEEAGYLMGQKFSEGLVNAWNNFDPLNANTPASSMVGDLSGRKLGIVGSTSGATGNSYAVGLPRVPYDNFPALLHEGEAVLTAQQARSYQSGATGGVVITGNSFTVREDADIYRIASALYDQIKTTAASFVG